MRNTHNYFHNLKRQYKCFIANLYEQTENIYLLGRLRAYIDAGFDTGIITYNTWRILHRYVDKILRRGVNTWTNKF